jgi:hypothetical protein
MLKPWRGRSATAPRMWRDFRTRSDRRKGTQLHLLHLLDRISEGRGILIAHSARLFSRGEFAEEFLDIRGQVKIQEMNQKLVGAEETISKLHASAERTAVLEQELEGAKEQLKLRQDLDLTGLELFVKIVFDNSSVIELSGFVGEIDLQVGKLSRKRGDLCFGGLQHLRQNTTPLD